MKPRQIDKRDYQDIGLTIMALIDGSSAPLSPAGRPRHTASHLTIVLCVTAHFVGACSSTTGRPGRDADLTILSLNLHTYQELRAAHEIESELTDESARQRIEAYDPIFERIAAGIARLDPDIICFQEVGEWPGDMSMSSETVEFAATDTNMVHQILARLPGRRYYFTMDWSHFGWGVWLEGSAVLSKYPLTYTESRFISNPENGRHEFWKSRNVPMAKTNVPAVGSLSVFSVHAGWWDDAEEPFQEQFHRLLRWVAKATEPASTTLLCGDFNVPAGSQAYSFMTGFGYSDQYALANPGGMLDATIGAGANGWEHNDAGERIDYIMMNDDSPLEVTHARRVFTAEDLGRVSDHVGVYAEFRRRRD